MLRVVICHPNQNFIKTLEELLYQSVTGEDILVFVYSGSDWMVHLPEENMAVDILIVDMDIALKREQELLKLIEKQLPGCVPVLTSRDGLINGELLKVMPYRCLYEKDVSVRNAIMMKEIVNYALLTQRQVYIWGYVKKAAFKISPDDIIYVSIAKHGSIIHLNPATKQGKISAEMRNRAKISELFAAMDGYGFAYAHNSYFINLRYVVRHTGTEVEMEDGNILSISRSKGKNFNHIFSAYQRSCFG